MQILVTFAVDAEFAPWRKLREFRLVDPILNAYETLEGDAKICVVLTGVRCEHAWDVTAISIWREHLFDVCISSGLAGGLKHNYRSGDVLVAGGIRDYKPQPLLPCDPDLVKKAAMCGAKLADAFYMSDRILVTADQKRMAAPLGDAVDMESRIVVDRCQDAAFAARCVAIRAISDTAQEDLPIDFNRTVTLVGSISLGKVMKELIHRPQALPALVRFGLQSRRAAESLARFLDRYVSALVGTVGRECLEEVSAT